MIYCDILEYTVVYYIIWYTVRHSTHVHIPVTASFMATSLLDMLGIITPIHIVRTSDYVAAHQIIALFPCSPPP